MENKTYSKIADESGQEVALMIKNYMQDLYECNQKPSNELNSSLALFCILAELKTIRKIMERDKINE